MARCQACGSEHTGPCPEASQETASTIASGPGFAPATSAATARAQASSAELEAGQMVGEYRIEGKLGQGAMGSVYAAIQPVIKKRAAIKVISPALSSNPEAAERFVQEARAVNEIAHPSIVDIFSLGTLPDGRLYFVMEWLKGESLGDRMRRGPIEFAECLDILDQVVGALIAAHEAEVVHRDLKPDNIFLVASDRGTPAVKLLDFGLAKLQVSEDRQIELTRSGMMMGTPLYLSPEQARGEAVDYRADVYSLGVMAFEMLVGQPPFLAISAMEIVAMHLFAQAPAARSIRPDLPAELDAWLGRALEKEPGRRPELSELRRITRDIATKDHPHGFASTRIATPVPAPAPHPMVTPVPAAAMHSAAQPAVGPKRLVTGWMVMILLVAMAAVGAVILWQTQTGQQGSSPSTLAGQALADAAAPQPPPAAERDRGAEAIRAAEVVRADAGGPAAEQTRAGQGEAASVPSATLRVQVNVPGATIVVGDRQVNANARGRASLEVASGTQRVTASAPGRKSASKQVELAAGDTTRVSLRLSRTAKRPPAEPSNQGGAAPKIHRLNDEDELKAPGQK